MESGANLWLRLPGDCYDGSLMGATDQRGLGPRRKSFEPTQLQIPAPQLDERREKNRLDDEEESDTHVIVIDIS